ncbi:hypothetical protein BJF78_29090 [Pseudonocardia sp. CNS-139]|nr:hypothetical protein BJF78_29090 [Pseudonocardia sp. CNS-139]
MDYSALPDASPGLFGGGTNPGDLVVPVLVFAAALLAAIALFWALRQRNAERRERVTVPDRGAPLTGLTALAAIPAPRPTEVAIDDTGPIPTITAERISDSGPMRAVTDTGSHRWGGPARRMADEMPVEAVVESTARTGTLTETGPQRAVTDTGSHRAVSESGAHRMPRARARHSMRR